MTPSIEVAYDGLPRFRAHRGHRSSEYAVNTDAEVILADGRFYACDQGVWYISDDPIGPWRVSDTRPLGVDDIPPSCPVYNVRYVYIYDSSPSAIEMGYLPGYLGCYPYDGTVVYGTGYRYHPGADGIALSSTLHVGLPRALQPLVEPLELLLQLQLGFPARLVGPGRDPRRNHRHSMWFGPGGYRRPLLSDDMRPRRTRYKDQKQMRAADRPPMNYLPPFRQRAARRPDGHHPGTPVRAHGALCAGSQRRVRREGWKRLSTRRSREVEGQPRSLVGSVGSVAGAEPVTRGGGSPPGLHPHHRRPRPTPEPRSHREPHPQDPSSHRCSLLDSRPVGLRLRRSLRRRAISNAITALVNGRPATTRPLRPNLPRAPGGASGIPKKGAQPKGKQ